VLVDQLTTHLSLIDLSVTIIVEFITTFIWCLITRTDQRLLYTQLSRYRTFIFAISACCIDLAGTWETDHRIIIDDTITVIVQTITHVNLIWTRPQQAVYFTHWGARGA